jgi:hypothetical protein
MNSKSQNNIGVLTSYSITDIYPNQQTQTVDGCGTTNKIKPYDGNTNPQSWILYYESITEQKLWNNEQKLNRISFYLINRAKLWLLE